MKTFPIGGVHPSENKLSGAKPIEVLPLPDVVTIPLAQHIGAPAVAKVAKGDKTLYCYDDNALPAAIREAGRGYTLQRYKGLGEMNPEQLWETTLNPDGRRLVQVTIEDLAEAERRVTILMGDKVEPRKAYISAYANFNRADNFKPVAAQA